ncbi:unnamed protein product [Closterium sp. Yama58-4]|nr:unnamed protein product [Closterium sp. Yama58-4]
MSPLCRSNYSSTPQPRSPQVSMAPRVQDAFSSLEAMPSSPNHVRDRNVAQATTAGDGPGDATKISAKLAMPRAGSARCTVDAVMSLLSNRLFIAALALTVASLVTFGMFQGGREAEVLVTNRILAKAGERRVNGSVKTTSSPAAPRPFKPPAPVKLRARKDYLIIDKYDWAQLNNQRPHVCYAGVPCSLLLLVPKDALNGTNDAMGDVEKEVAKPSAKPAANPAAKPAAKSAMALRFDDEIQELERLLLPHTEVLLADVMVTLYGPSLQHASLVSQTATPNGPLLQLSVLVWDVGEYRCVGGVTCGAGGVCDLRGGVL